jgi:hypothetical protein
LKIRDEDNSFVKKVKDSLDRGEETIDSVTLSRLNRIRLEALKLKTRETTGPWKWFPTPLPTLATAGMVLLAVFLFSIGDRDLPPGNNLEDLEILASTNKLEFYEDLDFYAWLAEEQPDAG